MGVDHTAGCMNFRDVGDLLEQLADRPVIPTGRLLRGGKLTFIADWGLIERPRTIINLRGGPDPVRFDSTYLHFPRPNNRSTYNTADRGVRRWLREVLTALASAELPVMLHCTSGKDRTGVVVAAVLTVLGVERALIEAEYLFSDGDVRQEWIAQALDGIGDPAETFRRVPLDAIRQRFLQ